MVYSKAAMERAMKLQEVILRAISKQMHWFEAARIAGLSPRQLRRLYYRYRIHGYDGLVDGRRKCSGCTARSILISVCGIFTRSCGKSTASR